MLFTIFFEGFANAQFRSGVPSEITADEIGQITLVKTTPVVGHVQVSLPAPQNRATIF